MSARKDALKEDAITPGTPFTLDRDSVIAEVVARVAITDLRELRFTTLARAGSYMAARLRFANVLCAVALDGEGRYVCDKLIGVAGKWDFRSIFAALSAFSDKTGVPYMILGASRAMPWEVVLPFNSVYEDMAARGVKILDLIEVTNGAYLSLLKSLSKGNGDFYKEFT